MKNINISLYRVQIHPPKKRKRAFQDPSKYPPRTPQNRPRRHLDLQGPFRSSQGLSGRSLGPSQDASGTPSWASQDTPEGPGTLPGPPPNPQVSAQGPFRSSQGVSGTSLGPSQMPQDPPPRPPRTSQNPLGPFQDLPRTLKHPLRTSQTFQQPPGSVPGPPRASKTRPESVHDSSGNEPPAAKPPAASAGFAKR